ncbi:hypothetical protein [Solemya pervernicosa gill symbiont]|nr:hypothetical protein [Solemya pervernicosa gill symbiont]
MSPDTREFLDRVACIAQANVNYLHNKEHSERSLDDEGSALLMSAYLELYDQFMGTEARTTTPSSFAYAAAESCCTMRRTLEQLPKHDRGVAIFARVCFGHPSPSKQQKLHATVYACGARSDEEHGLFTLMLGFMFMFKHLYVVKG